MINITLIKNIKVIFENLYNKWAKPNRILISVLTKFKKTLKGIVVNFIHVQIINLFLKFFKLFFPTIFKHNSIKLQKKHMKITQI